MRATLLASVLLLLAAPTAVAAEKFKPTKLPERGSARAESAYESLVAYLRERWTATTFAERRPPKIEPESFASLTALEVLADEGVEALPVIRRILRDRILTKDFMEAQFKTLKKKRIKRHPASFYMFGRRLEWSIAGHLARSVGALGAPGGPVAEDLARALPGEAMNGGEAGAYFANIEILKALRRLGEPAAKAAWYLRKHLVSVRWIRKPDGAADRAWVERRNKREAQWFAYMLSTIERLGAEALEGSAAQIVDTLLYATGDLQQQALGYLLRFQGRQDAELVGRLRAKDKLDRVRAPKALALYAKALMKELRREDRPPAPWAQASLEGMGDAVYDPVLAELKEGYRAHAYRAALCRVLGRATKKGRKAARYLATLAKDMNPVVRAGALEGLALLGTRAKKQLPAIEAALADENETVRAAAAKAKEAVAAR